MLLEDGTARNGSEIETAARASVVSTRRAVDRSQRDLRRHAKRRERQEPLGR